MAQTYCMKTLLFIVLSLAAQIRAEAGEPRLVYDLGHGQTSVLKPMEGFAKRLGFQIQPMAEPLSGATLQGAQILYLRAPTKAYLSEEKSAVLDFVKAGGSLLVVLDEEQRTGLAATGINDILEPLGLELTADVEYLHNTGAIAKAGVINSADRELPYSGGRAVQGGTPFAWQLDREGRPAQAFASHLRIGSARVIVMAEAMASAWLGSAEGVRLTGVPRDPRSTAYWGKDSGIFMDEVFAWLLGRSAPPG